MARVLRADPTAPSVIPGAVADASAQARAILERARALAEEREREAIERGRVQARAEVAAQLVALADARERLVSELEPQLVGLAVLLAKRIIGEQLALEPARISQMAAPLLARLRRARQITLRVHPDDRPALESGLQARRDAAAAEGTALHIESDPALQRGDCVVISDAGVLDARIDTQLQALSRALGAG